jgi:hypothetical protein
MSPRGTLLSPPLDDETRLFARSGWQIPTETVEVTFTVEELRNKANVRMREWTRGLQVRSLSAYPYNCIGMIFAFRRAWIEPEHLSRLLVEDGYRKIDLSALMPGDVVVYEDKGQPAHVALVISIEYIGRTPSVRVISKWGGEPEYIHFMENVPDRCGRPTAYYTDRVP